MAAVDITVNLPKRADLVNAIKLENEKQELGLIEGKLKGPLTILNGKIFLRTALIRKAYEPLIFAYPGQNKTIQIIKRHYWWKSIAKEIKRYIKNCRKCGRNKTQHNKTSGLLHPLPIPNYVWEQIAVNGKDMPKDEYGYNYI